MSTFIPPPGYVAVDLASKPDETVYGIVSNDKPHPVLSMHDAADELHKALARNPDLAAKLRELDVALADLDKARTDYATKTVQQLQSVPLMPYQRVATPTSRRERRALARRMTKRLLKLKAGK
jgi:hypothetical protein